MLLRIHHRVVPTRSRLFLALHLSSSSSPTSGIPTPRILVDAQRNVCISGDNATLGKQLRKIGFKLDKESNAWIQPRASLVARLGAGQEVDLSLESILKAAAAAPEVLPKKRPGPSLHVLPESGLVQVRDSFVIKDQLKAAGFTYAVNDKAWVMSEANYEDWIGKEKTIEFLTQVLNENYSRAKEIQNLLVDDDDALLQSFPIRRDLFQAEDLMLGLSSQVRSLDPG